MFFVRLDDSHFIEFILLNIIMVQLYIFIDLMFLIFFFFNFLKCIKQHKVNEHFDVKPLKFSEKKSLINGHIRIVHKLQNQK